VWIVCEAGSAAAKSQMDLVFWGALKNTKKKHQLSLKKKNAQLIAKRLLTKKSSLFCPLTSCFFSQKRVFFWVIESLKINLPFPVSALLFRC
jgi:hypothetical protein